MILKEQQKNTVSVFVSDCILDLPKGAAKNYFINNQIAIEAIVSKKLKKQKDLTFVVFRLMSRFYGKYTIRQEAPQSMPCVLIMCS